MRSLGQGLGEVQIRDKLALVDRWRDSGLTIKEWAQGQIFELGGDHAILEDRRINFLSVIQVDVFMSLKKVAYWLGSLLGGVLGSGKTSLPISRTPEPEKVPDTSLSHTLEQDTWEGTFFDVVAQRSAKKSVQFDYIDASGSMTQRVVDIRAYEPQGGSGLVIGQCRLRNATRGLLVFSAISDGTKS